MKNKWILLSFLLCFTLISKGQTTSVMTNREVNVENWINSHFAKGENPPFSFQLRGIPSKNFIRSWKYSTTKLESNDPLIIKRRVTYSDIKTGLKVECDVKGFKDFNAVEWVLHFSNTNKQNTPEISDIHESDINFKYSSGGDFILHYAEGSTAKATDFQPLEKKLTSGQSFGMEPTGGRSSQLAFPFFNIESPAKQGIMVAIGWSGTWKAGLNCNSNKSITLTTGIRDLKSYLLPDEKIRTASVCLLFWNGEDRMIGHNKFRQFILTHHTRQIDGKRTIYPESLGFNWNDPRPCNEYSCLTTDYAISMIKRYKQFGLISEVFWLDAGWYTGADDYANDKNWGNTVGNWTVNKEHFPDGLKPISDEIHRQGCKFMVWFEPERVYKGTIWAQQHPEWMLQNSPEPEQYLFNLGNPEACRWLGKTITTLMKENGIDYYRQDFNIEPDTYWKTNDQPGRQGMTEVKYIAGLYDYWDYILQQFPSALIDNCASGGRRLDLETISRSAPMWRTDYDYGEPVGYQSHTYGLNFYLPLSGTGTMKTDKFGFRSSLSSSIIYSWKISDPSNSYLEMQACQKEFRDVRPYFYEDFYPLTGTNNISANNRWMAYQLNRESDHSGFVIAFRRDENNEKEITVKLSGLSAEKMYQIEDRDTKESITKSGKELMNGFTLMLEKPHSSLLLFYKGK